MERGLGESELAQDRRAWDASTRDVVSSIGDAGSTRPEKTTASTSKQSDENI